jgi:hypothetical protein
VCENEEVLFCFQCGTRQVFIAGGSCREWECDLCGRVESGAWQNLHWLHDLALKDYKEE